MKRKIKMLGIFKRKGRVQIKMRTKKSRHNVEVERNMSNY